MNTIASTLSRRTLSGVRVKTVQVFTAVDEGMYAPMKLNGIITVSYQS